MTTITPPAPAPWTPQQLASHLTALAEWLQIHGDHVFACDCRAYREHDTGAWVHADSCAVHFTSSDATLRAAAAILAQLPDPAPVVAPDSADIQF